MSKGDIDAAPKVGTNIDRPVIDLYRPHITSGDCLIVTGYQDFLSSLAILINEVEELKNPDANDDIRIRISFGIDTANARRLAKPKPVSEEMKLYWLEKSGLQVEDHDDLMAVLAKRAIQTRKIELRVFDPLLAQKNLGITGDRRMHSKIVSSRQGAVAGSANFSRSGLYSNIEYADGLDAGSHELQIERTRAAEQIWDVSVDWTEEALEILDKLIKPATAEDAMARMIVEQKGFEPWLTGGRREITGHTLYEYQQELTYEACSITYDHGIVFVEAPTGSGKTEIGCHLAEALSETFRRVIPQSPVHGVARKNAAVIAPPKVIPSWKKHSTNSVEVIPNTDLARQHLRGAGDDRKDGLRLDQCGVLIIDESHTVTPGFEHASQMAAAVELVPPCWNVCLSATLLGNRDVDWLTHMQEKRASIFMTPDYIQEMGELFDREMQRSPDIFDQQAPLAVLSEPETALSRQARTELSQLVSPFLTRRQRRCIGQDEDRLKHSYPKLTNHGRPKTLTLTKPQKARFDEIVALCHELAPGGRVTAVEKSRFGNVKTQQSTQDQLHIRNLLNILRVNAAQAALQAGVSNFVLISTDKAVRPTNIMGSTKRLAELILQALSRETAPVMFGDRANVHQVNKTRFIMVRFGNVLGSSGSVIPLFHSQIKSGGPLTVTHPKITRYFMTIPEAAQLVIQAGSMGQGGDVFVLDMGEPVKIIELAEKMVHLSGLSIRSEKNPHGDISIEFTGLRPGEKLYEELLIGDNVAVTRHPMIMSAQEDHLPWDAFKHSLTLLLKALDDDDYDKVRQILGDTVSGYAPEGEIVDWIHQQRRHEP